MALCVCVLQRDDGVDVVVDEMWQEDDVARRRNCTAFWPAGVGLMI